MTRVVAQGTFELLHPGHLRYLREAASYGEKLHVIVARNDNITHKPTPVVPATQRREMIAALDPVDVAHVGDRDDIFRPIEAIEPDVIVLGHDQDHDPTDIKLALADRGIDCAVRRASKRSPDGDEILSTREIISRLVDRHSGD